MNRISHILRSARFVSDFSICNAIAACTTERGYLYAMRLNHTDLRTASPSGTIRTSVNSRSNSSVASPPPKRARKVTTLSLASKKRRGHKITMVTAYDYPSAVHVDRAGIDIVLVGDSCAMVELGFETTQV